jgi:large conductance mechanosensitive channel
MGMLNEFREFAMRGSVVDLAVGVIIGAAFGSIVKSLVDDVMMPPLGYLMGGVDFSDKVFLLAEAGEHPVTGKQVPKVEIKYGKFLNASIQFAIQAFAIFLLIKGINRLKRKEEAAPPPAPPPPTRDQELLTEIRDLLRKG